MDTYQPFFYVIPKVEFAGSTLFQILYQQSNLKAVEWKNKFTDLSDTRGLGPRRLIFDCTESTISHKTLLKDWKRMKE